MTRSSGHEEKFSQTSGSGKVSVLTFCLNDTKFVSLRGDILTNFRVWEGLTIAQTLKCVRMCLRVLNFRSLK